MLEPDAALQLESVDARHPHIRNQADRQLGRPRLQKFFRGSEYQGTVPGRSHQALYRLTNSIIIIDRRDDVPCRTCVRTDFSNHDSIITAGAEEAPLYVYLACPAPHASVSGRAGPGAGPGSLRIRSLRTHRQGRERDEKSD